MNENIDGESNEFPRMLNSINLQIFYKGMENLRYLRHNKKESFINSVTMALFYVGMCVLIPYRNLSQITHSLFLANGLAEAKRAKMRMANANFVYARKYFSSLKELFTLPSIISIVRRRERVTLIIEAILNKPKGTNLLGRWIEFSLLSKAIDKFNVKEISSFGHYDEFTYWLSTLCKLKCIKYVMYQHGVVSDIKLPNLIHCNELHVYNEFSKTIFQSMIISNEECTYSVDGLSSSVLFNKLEKAEGKKYIGVIDQYNDNWTENVINAILTYENYIPVVMLRPYRKKKIRITHLRYPNIIFTCEKYYNLDCIISECSTLVLDYLSVNNHMPIICTSLKALHGIFSEYNLLYAREQDLSESLKFLG